MAGFDEGAVFYSYQRTEDAGLDRDELGPTKAVVVRNFAQFIRTYQISWDEGKQNRLYYRDELFRNRTKLSIDLQHIKQANPHLAADLEERPQEMLPLLEQAAAEVLREHYAHGDDGAEPETEEVQVMLYSSAPISDSHSSIRDLAADRVSRLVQVQGIITAAAKPKHKSTYLTVQCRECKGVTSFPCLPGMGGANIPRVCTLSQGVPGAERCPLDSFAVLPDRSKYIDQQQLKLQEKPEDVPTGEMPRTVMLLADRQLANRVAPGTRVTVLGIYCTFKGAAMASGRGGAVALSQPYIRVLSIVEDAGETHNSFNFTQAEISAFEKFAKTPRVHDSLFSMIAPNIFGHDAIKQAVACLLFGGARKTMPDATTRRGDINVLLLGDPSTAKSQFLKFASKVAPIAVYTSGKGSSAAGLMASVVQDAGSREFFLEGGAMVLADNGVVCIDEFDKMRPEDRVAIHEAMEQQTISIAKAGITTVLRSRCSVLAAANPPSGRYDDMKSAADNIDLQSTILSRFDLIFLVKDNKTQEEDRRIAEHVLEVHRRNGGAAAGGDGSGADGAGASAEERGRGEEVAFLRRYIHYARSQCFPRLSEGAQENLESIYVKLRQEARQAATDNDADTPPVPITVRQLEALIRISESLARMALQPVASQEHVKMALELFTTSTMDAVKSGVTKDMAFTEEQRSELQGVEEKIKRRMHIGAVMTVRRLQDELVALGDSPFLVTRALAFMASRGDVELRRERSLVVRIK